MQNSVNDFRKIMIIPTFFLLKSPFLFIPSGILCFLLLVITFADSKQHKEATLRHKENRKTHDNSSFVYRFFSHPALCIIESPF